MIDGRRRSSRGFVANTRCPRIQRGGIFRVRANGIVKELRSLFRLTALQSDLAKTDTRPRKRRRRWQFLVGKLAEFVFSFVDLLLRQQRTRKQHARFLHVRLR